VGFFDAFTRPAADEVIDPGVQYDVEMEMLNRPEGWLGIALAADGELGRSERAVVQLAGITAYAMGFEFRIKTFLRDQGSTPSSDEMEFSATMGGYGAMLGAQRPPRIGVAFSDGRKAALIGAGADEEELGYSEWMPSIPSGPWETEPKPGTHIYIQGQGGGGSSDEFEQSFWVWGRPSEGPLTFVSDWEEFDLVESQLEVDGKQVLEASLRSRPVWE
jgi:hypothetical protein